MTDFITPGAPSGPPIADLTYRDYNGPLHTRAIRWWIVAASGLRMLIRKPGFWIVAALALFPYVFAGLMLWAEGQGMLRQVGMLPNYPPDQKYAAQFFGAQKGQWLWLFVVAMMAGASSIAADNRANALLVYLSKPLTKGDYLLGKWMGIFLAVYVVALVPALVLYLFCLISFLDAGFLKNEPWLIFRIAGAVALPAAVHASLLVGFSAWSKTPRIAGAAYAALFLLGNTISGVIWAIRYRGDLSEGILVRHLSINGIIDGLAQNLYGVTLLTVAGHRRRGLETIALDPPLLWAMLLIGAVVVALGIGAARAKINAVEVIRG
ncbi:MAG: ABC transporter permease [Actinomycetota bacterium]